MGTRGHFETGWMLGQAISCRVEHAGGLGWKEAQWGRPHQDAFTLNVRCRPDRVSALWDSESCVISRSPQDLRKGC